MSFAFTSPQPLFSGLTPPSSLPPYLLAPTASLPPLVKRKTLPVVSSSGTSWLTLTALGVGAGLGGFFVLLAMCLFALIRKRRKPKRLDQLPSKHEAQPQQWPVNVSPKVTKPAVSPNVAVKSQLPPIPSSFVVPIASASCDDGPEDSSSEESIVFSNMTFSYKELVKATDNFSSLLGQGGFGYVHKGVLLDGKEVAVKQLKSGSGQGEREFQAEVDTISSVQHKHLVSLVGYCISGDKRLLVYEFVPNKTLESHLHGEGRLPLSWSTRLKIALGAARGLVHLHEVCHPKIIHRDIKASNILLDDNFEAKVADFGLAKFSYDSDTHVSTRVMGTFGYLAPEYAASGKLTEKSDVFSFGVVLLELITGRRPIETRGGFSNDDGIVEWARPLLREALETGKFDCLVDPKLKEYNAAEMAQMVACAAACVQSAGGRPQMSQIVQALEGNLPIKNLFNKTSSPSSAFSGSSIYEQHKENLKKFQKLALESSGPSSSGFSAIASDSVAPLPSISISISISSAEHQKESQDTVSGNSNNDNEDVREIPIL